METSSPPSRRYTIEEYARLLEPDDHTSDLVRGVLVREPRPGSVHGIVQVEVARLLANHVREHGGGWVVAESGVILERDPPTVRGPDVAYYAPGRFPGGPPAPFFDAPPDLVVEVLSPSESAAALQEKVRDYLRAGVRAVWTLDPERRTAVVYGPGEAVRFLAGDDALDGAPVLPGFSAAVGELFPF